VGLMIEVGVVEQEALEVMEGGGAGGIGGDGG
jgi:hypothetical protein